MATTPEPARGGVEATTDGRTVLLSWSPADGVDQTSLTEAITGAAAAHLADGAGRVEARVRADDLTGLRAALRGGLLREGTLRGAAEDGTDLVVLGRVPTDHDPSSRQAFNAMLNSTLPRKRQIAQGLVRNAAGAVMLCELVYKREWDLPGGVVDPGESPAACVERELAEETGLVLTAGDLLAVDWLPPYRGWDDATLLLFDLGVLADDALDGATLQPREIAGLHWADAATAAERTAPYTARLLTRVLSGERTTYLEDSNPRGPRDHKDSEGRGGATGG